MKCPNCGAEISYTALKCSYCGNEIDANVVRKHQQDINSIYAKIGKLLGMPGEIAGKFGRILKKIVWVGVAIFICVIIGAFVYSKVAPNRELKEQKKNVSSLEELYQKGEYKAIYDKMSDMEDSYLPVYYKYGVVSDLYRYTELGKNQIIWDISSAKNEYSSLSYYSIKYLMKVLDKCDTCEENGYIYDEQKCVSYYRSEVTNMLKDELLCTDEDIKAMKKIYKNAEEKSIEADYSTVTAVLTERLRSK